MLLPLCHLSVMQPVFKCWRALKTIQPLIDGSRHPLTHNKYCYFVYLFLICPTTAEPDDVSSMWSGGDAVLLHNQISMIEAMPLAQRRNGVSPYDGFLLEEGDAKETLSG